MLNQVLKRGLCKLIFLGLFVLMFFSCKKESELAKEVAKIPVDISFVRFEKIFSQSSSRDLPRLKKEFPEMFPERFADSVWEQRLKDTIQLELWEAIQDEFSNFTEEESKIVSFFQYLKYYNPQVKFPVVQTVVSDVDYRNRVYGEERLLLVGIDNYLGSDHELYKGLSRYQAQNMSREYMVADIADYYAKKQVMRPAKRTLLSQMIYYGKIMYLKDLYLPKEEDAIKIGFTQGQIDWVRDNEQYMWQYFVERKLLFDTDPQLVNRFVKPAPFSKFYLGIDNESPGRVGVWLGWQIVKAYMGNNDVSLGQMLAKDSEEIFRKSKYKPAR